MLLQGAHIDLRALKEVQHYLAGRLHGCERRNMEVAAVIDGFADAYRAKIRVEAVMDDERRC